MKNLPPSPSFKLLPAPMWSRDCCKILPFVVMHAARLTSLSATAEILVSYRASALSLITLSRIYLILQKSRCGTKRRFGRGLNRLTSFFSNSDSN